MPLCLFRTDPLRRMAPNGPKFEERERWITVSKGKRWVCCKVPGCHKDNPVEAQAPWFAVVRELKEGGTPLTCYICGSRYKLPRGQQPGGAKPKAASKAKAKDTGHPFPHPLRTRPFSSRTPGSGNSWRSVALSTTPKSPPRSRSRTTRGPRNRSRTPRQSCTISRGSTSTGRAKYRTMGHYFLARRTRSRSSRTSLPTASPLTSGSRTARPSSNDVRLLTTRVWACLLHFGRSSKPCRQRLMPKSPRTTSSRLHSRRLGPRLKNCRLKQKGVRPLWNRGPRTFLPNPMQGTAGC